MLTGLLTRRLRERSWFKNLLLLCEQYFNISDGLAVNKAVHTKPFTHKRHFVCCTI